MMKYLLLLTMIGLAIPTLANSEMYTTVCAGDTIQSFHILNNPPRELKDGFQEISRDIVVYNKRVVEDRSVIKSPGGMVLPAPSEYTLTREKGEEISNSDYELIYEAKGELFGPVEEEITVGGEVYKVVREKVIKTEKMICTAR